MSTQKKSGVLEALPNDVLSGRGKGNANHQGNKRYRTIVKNHQQEYAQMSTHKEKTIVAKKVLQEIRSSHPPGRFLTQTKHCIMWYPQAEENILLKIKQALREKSKVVNEELKTKSPLNSLATKKRHTTNQENNGSKSRTPMKKAASHIKVKQGYTCVNIPDRGEKPSKEDMKRVLDICKRLSPERG